MSPPAIEKNLDEASFPEIRGYRIDGILGEGAVGTVYRARRIDTGVAVALKVLHVVGVKRQKHIARLVKEGRVMSRLNHPGIVKGLDAGECDGRYFIAMELVDGASIRDLLESGRMFTEDEAIDLAVRVVKALDHAYRQGVVHRDIKPANLMLTPDGKVKVTDLGLAKDAIDLSLTRSDATVGTPQYIAPEQARDSQSVDHRSDMFSLGATLYHMVTGSPPFTGGSLAEIITQVLYEHEPPPEKLNPALSAPFSKLLGRLLAKRPDDRYQTYGDLLVDIERVRIGRDIDGAPSPSSAARRWSPWWIAIAAISVIALIGAFLSRGEKKDPDPVPPVVEVDDPSKTPRPDPALEAERGRIRDLMNLQNRLLDAVGRGEVDASLKKLDDERPLYTGAREQEQFGRVESRVKSEVLRVVRRRLFEAWAEVERDVESRLDQSAGPGILAEVRERLSGFERGLQEVPAFLDEVMRAEFGDRLASLEKKAVLTATTWATTAIRKAREQADALSFVQAERAITQLEHWQVGLFSSEHVEAREKAVAHIAAKRQIARASFQEEYSRFWVQFERELAGSKFRDASAGLDRFDARAKVWQREAPRESGEVVRYVASDRGDLAAVTAVWRRTIDALTALQRQSATEALAFGAEASRKRVIAIDAKAEGWPEEIVVRVAVPGGREIDHPLTSLSPDDAVRLAKRVDPSIQPRWLGLFYYFVSRGPGLSVERARAYLQEARTWLSDTDDPYRSRIDDWARVLNLTAQQRLKVVEGMHAQALAHYRAWSFKKAAGMWAEIRATYPEICRRAPERYASYQEKAEKAVPLEAIARRFTGADRTHLDNQHPLAFRLRWQFDAGADPAGLRFAWESWKKDARGLARVAGRDLHHRTTHAAFPASWGLRIPIRLNFRHDVRLRINVRTDANALMSLLCISLGGNIVGIMNLDGFEEPAGIPQQYRNQINVWEAPNSAGRDVMVGYASKFVTKSVATVPKRLRVGYRLGLGRRHELSLSVTEKNRLFRFEADGQERHQLRDKRLRDEAEIELRCWSKPLVVESIEVEGVAR